MNNKELAHQCLKCADSLINMGIMLAPDGSFDEVASNQQQALKTVQTLNEATDLLTSTIGEIKMKILERVNVNAALETLEGK